jgi:hypothetical protein
MKTRPTISRRTIPNFPWNFEPRKESVCFVLGLANLSWPRKEKDLPKDWPIAYKTVRWHRMDILKENREEFQLDGKNYVYLKDLTGKKHSIQDFIDKSIASIKSEKAKGKLKSVHSIAVFYDPHGKDEMQIVEI